MRVLFVINSLGAGGAERSLAEMIGACSGLEATILCFEPRPDGVQGHASDSGADVRFVSGHFLKRIRGLRDAIAEVHPNLVHTSVFDADVAARIAAAGSSVPVLTSLINTSYEPIRKQDPLVSAWRLRIAKALDGWTARHLTSHFHAITGAVRDAAVRDLGIAAEDVTVIERGRDPERLGVPGVARRRAARESLRLQPDDLVLVNLGRQEYQKGQWHLIDAMPKVLASCPDAVLLIAGREGNASKRLREAAIKAGLEREVRFLGHREDAPEILAAADLFIFPSLYEGLGGALIEAMALGVPIVASDLPAIREVVEPETNARLVPPGSPSDLANTVLELVRDPGRMAWMGQQGRQIFLDRFTIERSASRMLALFERVAAAGRHPA